MSCSCSGWDRDFLRTEALFVLRVQSAVNYGTVNWFHFKTACFRNDYSCRNLVLDRLKICRCAKFKAVDFNWIFLRVVKQISRVQWATASLPGFQKAPVLSGCPWPGSKTGCEGWACLGRAGRPCQGAAVCTEKGLSGACGWLAGRAELFVCGYWEQQPKVLFGFVQDQGVHVRPVARLAHIAGRVTLHPALP